jgi:sialate O-acetylesterase
MIHPLVPFAIKGAIWYQGESNRNNGLYYEQQMHALINGWRKVWNQGDFPFLYVQLAPYRYRGGVTLLPKIWEAQTNVLKMKNTGMAVTVDIGNPTNIHPKNKQDVGKRLALWALAKTYGKKDLVYSGPLYKSMKIDGNTIRLSFNHVGAGLISRDDKPLSYFTIAGSDGKFVEATAKIEGDDVVVSSDAVRKPTAVRFGWHQLAEPNLSNKNGLPASPFRTDQGK